VLTGAELRALAVVYQRMTAAAWCSNHQLGRVALPVTCAGCCMRGSEGDCSGLVQRQ
jgi:hypothetical protein